MHSSITNYNDKNAGYGIGRIKKWKSLIGEKVEIESDIATSTITYFRPSELLNFVKVEIEA